MDESADFARGNDAFEFRLEVNGLAAFSLELFVCVTHKCA